MAMIQATSRDRRKGPGSRLRSQAQGGEGDGGRLSGQSGTETGQGLEHLGVEKQRALREKSAGQRGGERVRKKHVWSPVAACLKPRTLIRENWERERRRNVGTHLGKALDGFGLFPQREGAGEGKERVPGLIGSS